jgi:2-C-methyl-D-erythritol 4-phosphate cytidylyltransferase
MNRHAIIVAGGKGLRMGAEIPKQFLELNGMPVLMHTIKSFRFDPNIQVTVVLPKDQFEFWKWLCHKHHFELPHHLVQGGETRFQSVRNGLMSIPIDTNLVAIHDGVRPILNSQIIEKGFEVATLKGSAIAVVRLKDSIRKQELTGKNHSVNRANYFLVQTPQTFSYEILFDSYQQAEDDNFTDDASVVEAMGNEISLIEGDYKNIKITTPEDLLVAAVFLQ